MPDALDYLTFLTIGGPALVDEALGWFAHSVYVENFTNQYVSFPDIPSFIPPYTARLLALPGVQKAKFQFAAPPGTNQVATIAGQICTATWSARGVPVTGGPIGPIGVTSNYYDRNPLDVVQFFSSGTGGLAPHATTARWTYTVPAARKAFVEALDVVTQLLTAATGGPGLIETAITVTPSGLSRTTIVDAFIVDSTGKPIGARAEAALGASIELQPGDALQGFTGNSFAAGTAFHQISSKITEFDS